MIREMLVLLDEAQARGWALDSNRNTVCSLFYTIVALNWTCMQKLTGAVAPFCFRRLFRPMQAGSERFQAMDLPGTRIASL